MRLYINNDWSFCPNDSGEFVPVRIPHNVKDIEYNYCDEKDYQFVAHYRKTFYPDNVWQGKKCYLTFEGVAHRAEVSVNGVLLATHKNGYTAFTCDMTDVIRFGEDNLIEVDADSRETLNQPPFGNVIDYLTYGGIYRDVYIEVKESCHIEDVFVSTSNVLASRKYLNLQIKVSEGEKHPDKKLSFTLRKCNGSKSEFDSYLEETPIGDVLMKGESENIKLEVEKAELWDNDHPTLYELKIVMSGIGTQNEVKTVRFGFKEVACSKEGFFLNGRRVKLRGLNRHQSYPYVGYAMPKSMQRLDADILRYELGLNAVRTSHYPQSHYFLDRCDEIGLLVFTEIPGWQHIGDDEWKNIAVENVKEMVLQYRNHTSIFMWGVRINESQDDHDFYVRTNAAAKELDSTRPLGGVRYITGSELLEDVYTYNDFIHEGNNAATSRKSKVTTDMNKGYLISEYNGHMYPTKAFDDESHRTEHALRHARVLDSVAGDDEIAGSFGWCMSDYNTHKDFGSGDKICYHGVCDMFRNPKEAAAVYKMQNDREPFLEVSSSMDIGEYPAGMLKNIYIYSNADMVRVTKNGSLIGNYCTSDKLREKLNISKNVNQMSNFSEFKNLSHGPVLMNDFLGNQLIDKEGYSQRESKLIKKLLQDALRNGMSHLSLSAKLAAARLMLFHHFKIDDGVRLYTKYISGWGEHSNEYFFEAVRDGKVIKTVVKGATRKAHLSLKPDHTELVEENSYDVALVRITARDDYDNLLPYYQDGVALEVSGCIELIGPKTISLKGGMTGVYIKTTGKNGRGTLTATDSRGDVYTLTFNVRA